MTTKQKIEALENALRSFDFKPAFCIKTDEINGKTFALAKKTETYSTIGKRYEYEQPITSFMTYERLNEYLKGCYDTHVNKYGLFK